MNVRKVRQGLVDRALPGINEDLPVFFHLIAPFGFRLRGIRNRLRHQRTG
jgi:hypothetical protein